ncbi:MAG: hypothetical protein RL653_1588 [Pseudomonadota bacterium]|jgi:pimeloyl-ACP methyl ester carboxylesterase
MTTAVEQLFLAALALALLLGGWMYLAFRAYRLTGTPPNLVRVRTTDGWELALHHRAAAVRRYREPVVLAHGLGVNHRFMDFEPPWSLAHALNDAGFDTWSVDFRGTGGSARWWKGHHAVDDHIQHDAPAVVEAVCRAAGSERALWVGHSLGGLIGLAAAATGPAGEQLAGVAALGAPVHFGPRPALTRALWLGRLLSWPLRLRLEWLTLAAAPVVGRLVLPLSDIVLNPAHVPALVQRRLSSHVLASMSHGVLRQLAHWMTSGEFTSLDGRVDYRAAVFRLRLPLFFAAGTVDHLAPEAGVVRAYEACSSPDKALHCFGRAHGQAEDYGHGDLFFGAGAPTEVFPVVQAWLERHATSTQVE